jgi:transposase InsO family protein
VKYARIDAHRTVGQTRVERLMRENGILARHKRRFKATNERVHEARYATREQAKADIFEYIEAFYNRKRLHSTLGYVSPQTYLQNLISSQQGSELAA